MKISRLFTFCLVYLITFLTLIQYINFNTIKMSFFPIHIHNIYIYIYEQHCKLIKIRYIPLPFIKIASNYRRTSIVLHNAVDIH